MMQKFLTVFTPTFNRAHTLERLYKSLCAQKEKNFLWLVIDDGSTDTTGQLIQSYIGESNFEIKYRYQENQGKQAAWNNALNVCDTPYFMCLDSDDALTDNALTLVADFLPALEEDDNIIGLRFNAFNMRTKKIDSAYLSNTPIVKSWFDEVSNDRYVGEKLDIFKTALIKKFLFPVSDTIKFIPENWMYASVAKAGLLFLYVPCEIRLFYDFGIQNRLTNSSVREHAVGHYIARSHLLKIMPKKVFRKNPMLFVKSLIRFSQTARLAKKTFRERMSDSGSCVHAMFSYVLGFFPV